MNRLKWKTLVKVKAILFLMTTLLIGGCATAEKQMTTQAKLNPAAYPVIDDLCQGIVDDGFAPGAALLIGIGDAIVMKKTYGNRMNVPHAEPMTFDTIFDLASLTKPTCTASAIMLLVQQGKLGLDDPVYHYVPEFNREDKQDITIKHLLTHSSGLPAYTSAAYLEEHYGHRPNFPGLIKRIAELDENYETGKKYVYSCLNYLTLAWIAQEVAGENMDTYLEKNLWKPLGMKDTTFYLSDEQRLRTAPTIYTQKVFRRGMVHDPLAYYAVSEWRAPGNAGGFSTVEDMSKYARMIVGGGKLGKTVIYEPEIYKLVTTDQSFPEVDTERSCGWGVWTSHTYATPLNEEPETRCLGHTGYTGTILWMDKLSKAYVILFTNCVYPVDKSENKSGVIEARKKVIETVLDHLDIYQDVRKN